MLILASINTMESIELEEPIVSPIATLFPSDVVTAIGPFSHEDLSSLYPEELDCIRNASTSRQLEFAAGRCYARKALVQLGIKEFPLLIGDGRAPIWPKGVIGSLSHASKIAAVAVTRSTNENACLGLDIEKVDRLSPKLWKMIFTSSERMFLENLPPDLALPAATTLFAVKEAFYKAQFPQTGAWLGFQDVSVELVQESQSFTIALLKPLNSFWAQDASFSGKFTRFSHFVAAGLFVPYF